MEEKRITFVIEEKEGGKNNVKLTPLHLASLDDK